MTMLLIAWTCAVAMIGYLNWRDDKAARRAANLLGILRQCAVVEGVGSALLVITIIVASLLAGAIRY